MTDLSVTLQAGGVAHWGRQVPLSGEVTTVGYEADWMSKLSRDGQADEPAFFRTLFIGMDKVLPDETVSTGYGFVTFEDIRTGDTLRGHVDWRVEEGQDYGTMILEEGSGFWKGVNGSLELKLDWSTRDRGASLTSGDPVVLIAFLEGAGTLSIPD